MWLDYSQYIEYNLERVIELYRNRITKEMANKMAIIKKHKYSKFFAFAIALMLFVETAADVKIVKAEITNNETQPAPEPTATVTVEPTVTPIVTVTLLPSTSPTPKPTPTGTQKPYVKQLKKVSGVKLSRYATGQIKVTWKKNKKAKYYRFYYSKKRTGKYRLAGVTKNTKFIVKRLKNNTTYYFYVQACAKKKKESISDSPISKKVHIKTKTFQRKTIFAGDSICQGIGYPGWAYPYMNIKGKKKVIAYRGLNTVTFHTKRIFRGKTGLQKLIAERPYRVYMMLGMNEIHARRSDSMIAEYKSMIKAIKQACPDTDIVLCAISPVTRAEKARHPGHWQIPVFNKKLKALAKRTGCRYFDYTAFLKDSGGYLKAQYAEGDGYHWKSSAYATFARVVSKYDKALDQ